MNVPQESMSSVGSTNKKLQDGFSEETVIVSSSSDVGRLQDALEAWEEMGALSRDVGAFLLETQSYALKDTLALQAHGNVKKRDLDASGHSERDSKHQKPFFAEAPPDEGVKDQVNRIQKMTHLLVTLESTHKELRDEVEFMLHESQPSLQPEDGDEVEVEA